MGIKPWYQSSTIWVGILAVGIAGLDALSQSGIVTDSWWQQVILAAIGTLTIWRRYAADAAISSEGK